MKINYFAGVSVALGVGLLFTSAPWTWMAYGMIAGAIAIARPALARWELSPGVREALCILVLAAVTYAILPEAINGDPPVSHDHEEHLVKAWQLKEDLLEEGVLYSWSHKWFAGYPTNLFYPIGGDLWVVSVYLLSFGLLEFSSAYAVAIWLWFFFQGYAVYFFGKRTFSPLVAIIGACLYLIDIGGPFSGGRFWTLYAGVWPIALSLAFSLIALVHLVAVLERGAWKSVGLFALFTGLSLITHPIQVINLALTLTTLLFAFWVRGGPLQLKVKLGRLAVGLLLGGSLGSLWLLPHVWHSAYAQSLGRAWGSFEEMGSKIYEGSLFWGSWPLFFFLGLWGSLRLLFNKQTGRFYVGLFSFFVIFVASTSLERIIGNGLASLLRERVEFLRFVMLLKPFWFLAAGYLIVCLIYSRAGQAQGDVLPAGPLRSYAKAFVVSFLLLPILLPALRVTWEQQRAVRALFQSQRPDAEERESLVRFVSDRLTPTSFFRVAHSFDDVKLYGLMDTALRLPVPLYRLQVTPASTFRFNMTSDSHDMLRAVNVRYLVLRKPMEPARGDFNLALKTQNFYIYEFTAWEPQPFKVLAGAGEVSLEKFDDEEILLRAAEGSHGTLRLNVTHFPWWKATRDGQEVALSSTQVEGDPRTGFMTVALSPGLYRFRFERHWTVWAGGFFFLVGVIGTGLCLRRPKQLP